ncbi:hypothetical protein IMY05_004G0119600 [Salix suchowensis]|nr:hypothetical protein IMY05_004G0119600 [Salix suchowensis]
MSCTITEKPSSKRSQHILNDQVSSKSMIVTYNSTLIDKYVLLLMVNLLHHNSNLSLKIPLAPETLGLPLL